MIPILVTGNSIAEVWENALLELWDKGVATQTSYDLNPLTGEKSPPSKDCMLIMYIPDAMAEPRLHLGLTGGPAELAEYELEVVDGVKDHWIKLNPEDTEWTYTYSSRLQRWGGQLNFATTITDDELDPDNPWVQLAYVRVIDDAADGKRMLVQVIPPIDQITDIVDKIVKEPFTRRALALTGFPAGDKDTPDLPCLRYIWVRGFYRDNCLKLDMHTHWRSRDLYGAALFNAYAITSLQKNITDRVRVKSHEKFDNDHPNLNINHSYTDIHCPVCDTKLVVDDGLLEDYNHHSEMLSCPKCYLHPYAIKVGSYTDVSDSAHIYSSRIPEFRDRFLKLIETRPKVERMWDLSAMEDIKREGREKAYAMIRSLDEKNDKVDFPLYNNDI
jgi:thymidylate synthase